MRKSKSTRSRRSARRSTHRRKSNRRKTVAPMETACLKETITIDNVMPNAPYEPQVVLTSFPRALDVADNYQEYRISRVEYMYTPKYDTFIGTAANNLTTVPYLWSKRLKVPAPTSYNLDFLKTMGAKPVRLDDKTLRASYRPNILQQGAVNSSISTSPPQMVRAITSPWLSTHIANTQSSPVFMDETTHFTHNFWIEQDNPNADQPACDVEVSVYFEFRKPWDKNNISEGALEKSVLLIK